MAIEDLALAMCTQFDQGGLPALLAKLEELRESMWWRSPHYDVFSGHAVVLAVEQACETGPGQVRRRQGLARRDSPAERRLVRLAMRSKTDRLMSGADEP
ncbi:hypothetical protein [Streptomyces sp. NPDC058424]|uniref:hypothetical protein n=1 Tax=Streptomyces sp. NPDC058424 TaxID=3346491 RepID=UPI0036477DD1